MSWLDHDSYIEICPPEPFDFSECLVFLARSDQEVSHRIKGDHLYKLIKLDDELVLLKIGMKQKMLNVEFLGKSPSSSIREKTAAYVWDWFDFESNLGEFYDFAARDKVLKPLIDNFYGLRIMGIPDLFEAIVWAITGQQINLTFAYTLKKKFVYHYGESLTFDKENYWLFPSYKTIASLDVEDLRAFQFSVRKAEYIIGVAKTLAQCQWTRNTLLTKQDDDEIRNLLMSIRGIGAWTADLVMMRCLHRANAFPIADVGLHNALKIHLRLEHKQSIAEVKEMAAAWDGWYAYATFYLWRLLYEHHA